MPIKFKEYCVNSQTKSKEIYMFYIFFILVTGQRVIYDLINVLKYAYIGINNPSIHKKSDDVSRHGKTYIPLEKLKNFQFH